MTTDRVDFVSENNTRYSVVNIQNGKVIKNGFYRDGKLLKRGMFVSEENYPQFCREYQSKLKFSRTAPMSVSDLEEWLDDWKEPVKGVGRICDIVIKNGRVKLAYSSRIDTSKKYEEKTPDADLKADEDEIKYVSEEPEEESDDKVDAEILGLK